MKNIGIMTNTEKDPALRETLNIVRWASDRGCNVFLPETMQGRVSIPVKYFSEDELCQNADFIVVLGGDGTILRAARCASKYGTPLLGVNFGTLGYLADVEKNHAIEAMETVLNGKHSIEKRMMLEAYISGKEEEKYICLNEMSITNSVFSRMITLSVTVNDNYLNTVKADGIIVSTPTGSTAYNLSAGGPILSPSTELISITHICPHALFSRPFVLSGDDVIKVGIKSRYTSICLSSDGQNSVALESGDTVVIKKSRYYTDIIKTSGLSFYEILRKKMVEVRI